MSLIQTPWTSQPPIGTQVNAAKAKDLGVIYLAVANEAGQLRDVISGGTLANPGGSSSGQGGRIWTFSGAQQANKAFTLPDARTAPDSFVVCARIRATATQAGSPGSAFGLFASGGQGGFGVAYNSSNQVGAGWLTTGGAGIGSYSSATLGKFYTVFATLTTSASGSLPTTQAWIDGAPATTNQPFNTGGGSVTAAINEIAVGAQHRSSGFLRNFKGDIEWVAIVYSPVADNTGTSCFNDSTAARLYASGFPYNVFQPIPRRIFVPVSAGTGLTSVYQDVTGNYNILGLTSVSQDVSASYNLRTSATQDASASYNLRTSATQDASASYNLRTSAAQDASASYNLRTSAAQDAPASYNLRTSVAQDTSAAYQIVSAGQVVASFAPTYNIRTTAQVDLAPGYAIRDILSSDINVGYNVAQAVQKEVSAAYSLRASAQQSLTGTYNVLVISTVTSNLVASYLVASELINRERLTFNGNIHRTASALSLLVPSTSYASPISQQVNISSKLL